MSKINLKEIKEMILKGDGNYNIAGGAFITSSLVTELIIEGVVVGIGSEIGKNTFNSLFNISNKKRIDFSKLINELTKRISKELDLKLQEQDLRHATGDLKSLQLLIEHYFNTPTDDRLEDATSICYKLIKDFELLGIPGFHGFMLTVNLFILVLFLREIQFNIEEDENIIDVIIDAIEHIKYLNAELLNWNRNNYKFINISLPLSNKKFTYFNVKQQNINKDLLNKYKKIRKKNISPNRIDAILKPFREEGEKEIQNKYFNYSDKFLKNLQTLLNVIDNEK